MLKSKSTITQKGQTTIPAKIRKILNLKPGDTLKYELEEGRVILKPVRGSILDVAGSIRPKKYPEDFKKVREKTKKAMVRRVARDLR